MKNLVEKIKQIKPEQAILWIGIILCLAAMYLTSSWRADYNIALEEYESSTMTETADTEAESEAAVSSEMESTESEEPGITDTSDAAAVTAEYEIAAETAEYVTELQNEYLEDIYIYGNVAGQEEAMLERIKEIQAELRELFNDNSFDDLWFQPQDSDAVVWVSYAAQSYSGTDIPVIWMCMTDEGMVAAYVTAVYDMGSDTFYDPTVYITTVGAGMYAYTESDETEATVDQKSVDEFIDDVQSLIDQTYELGLSSDETELESDTEDSGSGISTESETAAAENIAVIQ